MDRLDTERCVKEEYLGRACHSCERPVKTLRSLRVLMLGDGTELAYHGRCLAERFKRDRLAKILRSTFCLVR